MYYTTSHALTPEQVNSQCEAMWAAYAQCVELDAIVGKMALVDHICTYLTTHDDDVSLRIMEAYVAARFPTKTHDVNECGAPVQFCLQ